METGRIAAGSGQAGSPCRANAAGTPEPSQRTTAPRLDPFSLPVRFTAADEAADEQLRVVDLHRERVVLRRAVRGMRMALNLPVAAFRGVAIRLIGDAGQMPNAIAVVLEHADPGLSLPLFVTEQSDDVVAEWQSWGRALGLPLLVAEGDGSLREPFARLGAVHIAAPIARRRRRGAIARRRPSRLLRRKPARLPEAPEVHRDEREIIARH